MDVCAQGVDGGETQAHSARITAGRPMLHLLPPVGADALETGEAIADGRGIGGCRRGPAVVLLAIPVLAVLIVHGPGSRGQGQRKHLEGAVIGRTQRRVQLAIHEREGESTATTITNKEAQATSM